MSNQADIQEILAVLDERELSDDLFLGDIDADSPALQPIVAAWQEGATERCRSLLANHFRTRQRPKWYYDARQQAVELVDPEHIERQVEHIMDNQLYYRGELIDLGENLENVNCARLSEHGWEAQAVIRQEFIKHMCLGYATTRQARLAEKVAEFLDNWLQQRPLVLLPDLSPPIHILTVSPEHNAMGLGGQMIKWLEVLYSGVAEQMDDELLFRILRHMWFTMVQFRRCDEDTYRPGNHHLFECGATPLIFGLMFPEFQSLSSFLETAPAVIRRHLARSVADDGSSHEHSVSYGGLHLYDYARFYADLNDFEIFSPAEVQKLTLSCSTRWGRTTGSSASAMVAEVLPQ